MLKIGWYCSVVTVATVLLTSPPALFGRESISADAAYSEGIHAYFSGDSARAESRLAEAIQINPDDPRPHYFRGLSLLRLKRTEESHREMTIGAAIEARRPGRYPVGKSLERVQGSHRLVLERFRRQGRVDDASRRLEQRRTRYEQNQRREAEVLRQPVAVPLDKLIQPRNLTQWTQDPTAVEPPMEVTASADSPFLDAAGTTVESHPDPFGDDPRPTAAVNPFAIDATSAPASDADASPGGEKISSEKMWGIFGRVLRRASPLPSFAGRGGGGPFAPGGQMNGQAFDGNAAWDMDIESMPTDDGGPFGFGEPSGNSSEDDGANPFGDAFFDEPATPDDSGAAPDSSDDEMPEDDLFGEF